MEEKMINDSAENAKTKGKITFFMLEIYNFYKGG
jgi:hypothetical protein